MKADYQKPAILFESFELNQAIANNCGATAIGRTNQWSKDTCGWKVSDLYIWVDLANKCTYFADVDEPVFEYCYNTPTPNQQIFSS